MSLGHTILVLTVYTLAVGRVTKLVNSDVITDPIRLWIERRSRNDTASKAERARWGTLAYFGSCAWCVSMWVSFGFAWVPLYFADNPVAGYIGIALAVSYVVGLLAQLADTEDIEVQEGD